MATYSSQDAIRQAVARVATDLLTKTTEMLAAQQELWAGEDFSPTGAPMVRFMAAHSALLEAFYDAGVERPTLVQRD